MVPQKRWPKNAESFRLESIASARDIVSTGVQAKQAITAGNRGLALALVSEMQIAAQDIQLALLKAKEGI